MSVNKDGVENMGQPPSYTATPQNNFQQQPHATVVTAPPYGQRFPVVTQPPQDYMCTSILVTLFCFWPTGIIAIMRASEAREAAARGDMLTAHQRATSTRSMIRLTIVVGSIFFILLMVIVGVSVGLSAANSLRFFRQYN